jgi:Bacterial protein of unknown function (DUF899)
VGSDRQGVSIRDRRRSASLKDSSEGARSSSSITSCSGLTTRQHVRPARRSRTGSTASSSTWPTTTSRCRRCHGRRSRSCRRTSGGWGGTFPWASSLGSDFNLDFNVWFTDEQQRAGLGFSGCDRAGGPHHKNRIRRPRPPSSSEARPEPGDAIRKCRSSGAPRPKAA